MLKFLFLMILPVIIICHDNKNRKGLELVNDYFNERAIRVAVIFTCSIEGKYNKFC